MKKRKKSKENLNKKSYLISLGIFLLAVILTFVFTLTDTNNISDSSPFATGYSIIENSKLEYNTNSNEITDINGLNFSFDNGNILINNKRSLNLIVKEKSNQYIVNNQDFNHKRIYSGHKFSTEEEVDNVLIKENIIFNKDVPIKIVHSLKNKKDSTLENVTYYYTFDLFEGDDLIVNGSSCDYYGNCTYVGKDRRNRVNFNSEYDFVFDDLIANNFTLSDIKFEDSKLWLGFSINVLLEPGEEIELDPTFTTSSVNTLSIAPLGKDKVIVVWEDVTNRDATYRIYYTNGTPYSNEIDMNDTIRYNLYANHGVSASAFNATHFAACFYNHQAGDFVFQTWDINGVILSQVYMNIASWNGEAACSVSALNSTHFVIAYINGYYDDIEARVYSATGILASSVMDVDTGIGSGIIDTVSVSAFNSTHFVVGWFDNQSAATRARVFSTSGIGDTEITVDGWVGYTSRTAHVNALTSKKFAVVWDDNSHTKSAAYHINGTKIGEDVDLDSSNGNTDYTSIASINSTHYMTAWLDDADDDASIKGITSSGVNFTGDIIDVATSAIYDLDLGGEDVATGIQICNDKFVMAWIDNTSSARWGAFFSNGTVWNGNCVAEGPKINIIYPSEGDNYFPGMLLLNISASSDNSSIVACNYSINDGGINYSLSNTSNYWHTYMYFPDGDHTVTFFCFDNHSISANAEVSFTTRLDPIDINPDELDYRHADITPLGSDKFVFAYDEGDAAYQHNLFFDIYYTNGTQFGNTVDVGYFAYESPHVQAFNATHFVIGWSTSNSGTSYNGDGLFSIYNTNFDVIANWTVFADAIWTDVDIAVLNSTHFIAAYATSAWGGASLFKIYDSQGNLVTDTIEIEHSICNDGTYCRVAAAAINSTHFVDCYFNNYDSPDYNSLFCEVWGINGVPLGTTVEPDYSVHNYSMTLDVAAINSTHYVVSWLDYPSTDNTLAIYDIFGVQNYLWDSDDYVLTGSWDKSSRVAMLNSTHFVSAWTNPNWEYNASFRVYDTNSIPNTGIINASKNIKGDPSTYHVAGISAIGSQVHATGLGFCNDNFVMAWNETSNGEGLVWRGFTPSGEIWDGNCDDIIINIISPTNTTYSNISLPFNISAFSREYSISKCVYSVDGGLNYSMSNYSHSWFASRGIEFGPHEVTFYCNNTLGDWKSASLAFSMDLGNSSCTWWYNANWEFRKPITIDKDRVNGSQVNYPLFLNISDSSLQNYSKLNGDDIVFTDSGGCNKLDHEIEYFNKANGWLVAWIRIPALSNTSDTIINMYYSNNLSGNQQNETRVWSSDYKGVWHLKEDPSISGDSKIKDSTINRNNGTDQGSMTSGDKVFGIAAYGLDLDGSNDYVNVPDSSTLQEISSSLTYSTWLKSSTASISDRYYVEKSGADFYMRAVAGNRQLFRHQQLGDGSSDTGYIAENLTDLGWHYIVGVWNGTWTNIYVDGKKYGGESVTGTMDATGDLTIGYSIFGSSWSGVIDESRISTSAHSSDLINTTYMNMAFPSSFYSVGDEESQDIFAPNYSQMSINNTLAGEITLFSINITDDVQLSPNGAYIFSTNNSGVWVNNTPVFFSTNPSWANVTKTLNSTIGMYIGYMWYVNDSFGNTNSTPIYSFKSSERIPPQIIWENPTPENASITTNSSVFLNTTIIDNSTTSAWFDWNRSLIGYWSMDYYNSTHLFDNSSYRNNGTFGGGLSILNISEGARGKALDFDGVNDYVRAQQFSILNLDGTITYSWWANYERSNISYSTIFGDSSQGACSSGGNYTWIYYYNLYNSTRIYVGACNGTNARSLAITNYTNCVGQWCHYSIVVNYSSATIRGYQNGELIAMTNDLASSPNGWTFNDAYRYKYFGAYTTSAHFFNGSFDEMMIFNRALSEQEVKALYNNSKNRLYNNFTSLSEGNYTYYAHAIDEYGNYNKTNVRTVKYDDESSLDICATLSTPNRVYTLTSNVSSTGTCFTITANNVTLDCNGYWINFSTTPDESERGIYINQGNSSIIENCNIVSVWNETYVWRSGITAYVWGNGPTIRNNFINTSSTAIIPDGDFCNITSNNIFTRGYGVNGASPHNIFIAFNNITSRSRGIYLSNFYNSVMLFNKINSSNDVGISLVTGENITFANNFVVGYGTGLSSSHINDGVFINNTIIGTRISASTASSFMFSTNSTIINLTAITYSTGSSAYAITIAQSEYNNFTGINASGLYGIMMSNSNYTNIKDCTDLSLSTTDVYIIAGSSSHDNIFLNCTYDTESISSGNDIIRKWYYKAYVNYSNGTAAAGANVTGINITGTPQFEGLTNGTGWTEIQELTEYVNRGGTRVYFSNYTLNATKEGYKKSRHSFNVTQNKNKLDDFFTLFLLNSCDYISGNWIINCSENCEIIEGVDVGGNNISIIGEGSFITTVNITNYNHLKIIGEDPENICLVRCLNGGCFNN